LQKVKQLRKNAILRRIRFDIHISNHIIVTGPLGGLQHFLKTLSNENKEVVIFNEQQPNDSEWDIILKFNFVLYVEGSPLNAKDLQRCNADQASAMLILSSANQDDLKEDQSPVSVDAKNILAYRGIRTATFGIVDLVDGNSCAHLGSISPPNDNFVFNPYYAGGHAYVSSMLDTLICQAYFNPYIVDIFRAIVRGNIFAIPIKPDLKQFEGKTYKELFLFLLAQYGLISLGLCRKRDASVQYLEYFVTSPSGDTVLRDSDLVYCIPPAKDSKKKAEKVEVVNLLPEETLIGTVDN